MLGNILFYIPEAVVHCNFSKVTCIEVSMETLHDMRSEEEWKKIWEKAVSLATEHSIGIEHPRSRRNRRLPERLRDMVTTAETCIGNRETPIEEYRVQVYYAVIDVLITEMKQRFDDVNLSLMKSMQALHPKSDNFLSLETLSPLMSHYGIDQDEFGLELMTAKRFLQKSNGKLDFLHHVYDQLLPVPEGFPMLLKRLKIAMTFGVSSATAEHSFSSLRRIKNYLCSTMTQERLSNLSH